MMKSIKKYLIISSMLILGCNFYNVKAASNQKNILKSGYGIKSLNVAPRTSINKSTSSKIVFNVKDDNKKIKYSRSIVQGDMKVDNGTLCFKAGCTNKKHMHYTDKENIKVNITNTKNTDLLTKNSRNLTYSLTKNDLSSKNKATQTFITTDTSGLKSKISYKVKLNNGKFETNKSMRVHYSYTDNKINFILSDNNGIASNKAAIKITDKNANKTIATLNADQLAKQLTNTTKDSKGKIVEGVYSVDVTKFSIDKNDLAYIKIETTDGSGLTGYDMAKIKLDVAKKSYVETKIVNVKPGIDITASITPKKITDINREVRYEIDTSNKNQLKIKLKDNAGLSNVNLTTYTSDNKKIKEYTISANECTKNKTLETKAITYTGYNAKTNIATLTINKNYIKTKNNKINIELKTKDSTGLNCREKLYVTIENGVFKVNRGPRTSVSYSNKTLNFAIKDNDGIANNKASFVVYDLNNAKKEVINANSATLAKKLTSTKKSNNNIVSGTYKLDISKLKVNGNKYKIKIVVRDSKGHYRVENINLAAEF